MSKSSLLAGVRSSPEKSATLVGMKKNHAARTRKTTLPSPFSAPSILALLVLLATLSAAATSASAESDNVLRRFGQVSRRSGAAEMTNNEKPPGFGMNDDNNNNDDDVNDVFEPQHRHRQQELPPASAAAPSLAELLEATNHVEPSAVEPSPEGQLPTCPRGVSCGHLQANTRGINVVQYCTCRKSKFAKLLGLSAHHDCPLRWDSDDGKSITQGSNQYKFCEQVREEQRNPCTEDDVAYVVSTTFPHDEADGMEQHFRHYCTCPAGTKFELKRYYTKKSLIADTDIAEYTCVRLPFCLPEEPCKTVTQTPDSFLAEKNCACPRHLKCPTDGRPSEETEIGKGVVKLIPCQ